MQFAAGAHECAERGQFYFTWAAFTCAVNGIRLHHLGCALNPEVEGCDPV